MIIWKSLLLLGAAISFGYFTIAYFMRLWIKLRYRMELQNSPTQADYSAALDMAESHMTGAVIATIVFLVVFVAWFFMGRSETQTLQDWLLGVDFGYYR